MFFPLIFTHILENLNSTTICALQAEVEAIATAKGLNFDPPPQNESQIIALDDIKYF
jgi:hypothetical protein